jgi:hypothetical protein
MPVSRASSAVKSTPPVRAAPWSTSCGTELN